MRDAATIAVVGVAVVMAVLSILMIAIMVMTRLAPGRKEAKVDATLEEMQEDSPEKESVAAIAVAMALAVEAERNASAAGAMQSLIPGPTTGRWASAGREQLMRSRGRTGRRWGRTSG